MATVLSPNVFRIEGQQIVGGTGDNGTGSGGRKFRGLFGVTPLVCSLVWNRLVPVLSSISRPKHLLWALLFLKGYSSEHVNAALASADEKTFRKWSWTFVNHMGQLDLLKWSRRLEGREECVYKVSVDGTDVPICEPAPFDPKWFSHKFKGAGLRYEVGISIGGANIVRIHGPFPCGPHPDLKIFRLRMKTSLLHGEKVVADGGYNDSRCSASSTDKSIKFFSYVRARHEALNKRLKQFNVLKNRFRHRLWRHAVCFFAVANLTQLLIENGEPIFM